MTDYATFLAAKTRRVEATGLQDVPPLHGALFPFQRRIVEWALRLGRAAIFADTGLGKTLQQLVWSEQVARHTGRPVLILAPLAVAAQTKAEADRFGIACEIAGSQADVTDAAGVFVTNYEKLHLFDAQVFAGVVLDESSILKNYSGKTKRLLCASFAETPFRLACTATPAPNDHMEIGNQADFLGVMPANEMLSRWFINDAATTGTYRLKAHAARDFWDWVASWAVCVRHPRELGDDTTGYDLPELRVVRHELRAEKATAGHLFVMPESLSATDLHRQMRKSAPSRAAKVAEIVQTDRSGSPWLVWCHTNYEADELIARIPGAVDVRGSMSNEAKERALLAFCRGEIRVLITKPELAGYGMNFQHCCRMAFVGMSYSYEAFYQAARRCWRFGQKREVEAHIVFEDSEAAVLDRVFEKQHGHEDLGREMYAAAARVWGRDSERRRLQDYRPAVPMRLPAWIKGTTA